MPTLGELIDAGTTLLVFAEVGGAGGPPWYHQMYEGWFQETPYGYPSVEAFDCSPNRGTAASPMLLVNHWVSKKGLADPEGGPAGQRGRSPSRPAGALPATSAAPCPTSSPSTSEGRVTS